MKNMTKTIFGVFLVLIGITFLFETTGLLLPFGLNIWKIISLFWPLLLIFLGIKVLMDKNTTPGIILLLLGTVFLLTNLFSWNFFGVLWPLILIAIGISVFFKSENKASFNPANNIEDKDLLNETVAFWGVDKQITSQNFKGGEINVAFGGYKLDLRNAKISKDGAKLNVNAAFGGAEIFVPKDCRIVTNGTGIFGGWSPEISNRESTSPTLEISGSAIFGGVDIKE